jgi:hypothetical protein
MSHSGLQREDAADCIRKGVTVVRWAPRSDGVVPPGETPARRAVRACVIPGVYQRSGNSPIVEICVHWYAGRSKRHVSASLGDRKTVRKCLAPAEAAGIVPGGPPMSESDWAKVLKRWFPELADRKLNQVRWGETEPHRTATTSSPCWRPQRSPGSINGSGTRAS